MNDSQKNLILGIAIGVAAVSLIGMMTVLFKNQNPTEKSEKANTNAVNQAANPTPTQPTVTPPQVSDSDHIRGNKNAKITIIEFSDFQCPYCSRFHSTMLQVMAAYPNDVRWVYKHFPLDSIHPFARDAAEAAECAAEQNKFWEYADKLYENQSQFSVEFFKKLAGDLKLNTTKFNDCLDSGKFATKVNADYQAGINAGVRGTPGNFINGQSVPGAQPFENLKQIIDGLLQ